MNKNQKRKFSIVNYPLTILLLLAAMLFVGCSKDTPADNPDDPSNPVNVVMQNVALTGLVKDASGIPLSGVKVTTGSLNATTGKDGTFSFTQAGTVDSVAVVKFEKSGYFTLTRSGDQADAMYIEAMMYPTGNSAISLQTTFDASAAKSLQAGGVTIDLPAGCMAKADGSAYSGTVRADVLYLAPDNANAAAMMPGGDLTCIRSNNSKEMLLSFGIMDVVFTDNSGNLLKIKDKTNVQISFPAPSGATDATVPQWTFNEAKGVWVEDGTLTLKGSSYTGTVNHFSPRAGGKPEKSVTIQVHATACNKPASGASVMIEMYGWIYMDWGSIANGMTNGSGDCMLKAPANTNISIQTTYNGKSQVTSFETENYGLQIAYVNFDDGCGGWPSELTPCGVTMVGTFPVGSWLYKSGSYVEQLMFSYDGSINKPCVVASAGTKYYLVSVDGGLIKVQSKEVEYIFCTGYEVVGNLLSVHGGNIEDMEDFYKKPLEQEPCY